MRTDIFTDRFVDDEGVSYVKLETDATGVLLELTLDEARDLGQRMIDRANEPGEGEDPARPTTDCGCGYQLIWIEGQWQHDAAPLLWGDDHAPDEPAPTGPEREFWDREDHVTYEEEE